MQELEVNTIQMLYKGEKINLLEKGTLFLKPSKSVSSYRAPRS